MFKSGVLVTLLSLWLFAIFAPSIITIFENDGKSIITINLNEEEQQEQGQKNMGEKQIMESSSSDFSLLSRLRGSSLCDFYLLINSDHTSKIVLPPPEHFI